MRQLQDANSNAKHSQAWTLINDITQRKSANKGKLAGETEKERIENWYKHFCGLLGAKPSEDAGKNFNVKAVLPPQNIETGSFTKQEFEKAKSSLKMGKACGPDGIPPEVFRLCDFDDLLLEFCNDTLLKRDKPEQWSTLYLIPVPKSGDLSLTENYRGIALTCVIMKLYNKMLLNRIRPHIDRYLRKNQNGFRAGRSTVSQVLALRRIIEGLKSKNLSAIITFVDFKKAFDSINREIMFKILAAYGIPQLIVDAIAIIYDNVKAKVLSPDGETDWFNLFVGVLQGDTLAPYLFIIVLDYVMRQATEGMEEELGLTLKKRQSRRIGAQSVTDLDFADDLALLSNLVEEAQELLNRVEISAKSVGLLINGKKTEVMPINYSDPVILYTLSKEILKIVEDFKYLGSRTANTEKDIAVRKALAWKALNKLDKIWKSILSDEVKLNTFTTLIESILLYGCESWTLTQAQSKRLDGCYTRMLRKVQNKGWKDHGKISNSVLYGKIPRLTPKQPFCDFGRRKWAICPPPIGRRPMGNPVTWTFLA